MQNLKAAESLKPSENAKVRKVVMELNTVRGRVVVDRLGDDGVAQVFVQKMQFRSHPKDNRKPLKHFQERSDMLWDF